jgi:hypothetical protein
VQNIGIPLQRGYTTDAASALCMLHSTHWTWLWVSGHFFSFCEICKRKVFFGGKNYHILEITKLRIKKWGKKKKKKKKKNLVRIEQALSVCKGEDSSQPLHTRQFILLQVLCCDLFLENWNVKSLFICRIHKKQPQQP